MRYKKILIALILYVVPAGCLIAQDTSYGGLYDESKYVEISRAPFDGYPNVITYQNRLHKDNLYRAFYVDSLYKKLVGKLFYYKDALDGPDFGYNFLNGTLLDRGFNRNNKPDGESILYKMDGKPKMISYHKNGVSIGVWSYLHDGLDTGNWLIMKVYYGDNGKLLREEHYDSAGKVYDVEKYY